MQSGIQLLLYVMRTPLMEVMMVRQHFNKIAVGAFEPESRRLRTRQATGQVPPILESTFDPGIRGSRVQAQSRQRTQAQFE
ncbi:hypothetical protein PoB_006684500 [Plakobranchus ocellatus]|uniref:Uncharacterized protein n=1 Tax=Plakobranchus ocellatus TaxID=259542 RepID=A0AAV4D8G1_9GAST|nr:hypothetical protein PoB_006684500 [Plakobranchus ocellatus]